MSSELQAIVIVIGAVFGAILFGPSAHIGGASVGALLAWGALRLQALRAEVNLLNDEVKRLRPQLSPRPTVELTAQESQSSPLDFEFAVPPAVDKALEPVLQTPEAEFLPIRWVREFLTRGNAVVRIGVVILFFGLAFLLRYLAEHSRVPIEWRLAGIVFGGLTLLTIGWRLRLSRPAFALPLQGGGLGILYLTVFAALQLYGLVPATIAFVILGAVAVLSALLAVLQNSLSLAVLGVAGGFLAPVLASTGEGSHVVLFSYYTLLNAGIVAMAWFKAWRPLNIVGFVFTFGIGTVWGVLRYQPELFASTEPFLIVYFLFYLTIAVLFTLRQPVKLAGYIDGVLVFGTPIVVFTLQSMLLRDRLMPLAYSAVVMAAAYLLLAWLLRLRHHVFQRPLSEAFIAIGVALLTLAVPLALNARWNVAAWSLEATALVWVGCRQHRPLARLAGILLCLACGFIEATQFDLSSGRVLLPLDDYAGVVLHSVAAILAAMVLYQHRQHLQAFEQSVSTGLFWWGLGWWSAGGASEITRYWPDRELAGLLILLTFTTQVCALLYRRVGKRSIRVAALLQLPLMLTAAGAMLGRSSHPSASAGWLAWPIALIGLYASMYQLEGIARGKVANFMNAGATWLVCGLFGCEAAFQAGRAVGYSDVWPTIAWAVLPSLFLWLLPRLIAHVAWPFAKNRDAYFSLVGLGIAVFLYGWSVAVNLSSMGDFEPLPYLPLVNPLDLMQAAVLLILWRYSRLLIAADSSALVRVERRVLDPALTALGFLWLNAVLLRTLHQWFGVAYGWSELLASTLVQTSMSIFWASLAFVIMTLSARRERRITWIVGASLLGIVIAKLFLIDLSRGGSIERIVSFVGVGLLMLVIGYISPLPPVKTAE